MTTAVIVEADVFNGRENDVVLKMQERDPIAGTLSDMSFANISRMVLVVLADTPVSIDSDIDGAAFDWATAGQITMNIGDAGVPEGEYYVRLTAWDGSGNDVELIHEDARYRVKLRFWDTTAH